MIAIYHDDPETTPPDHLRSDAALVVPEGVAMPDGLVEQHIAGGRYAHPVHVGPYEQLGDVWARFFGEWVPAERDIGLATGSATRSTATTPAEVPKEHLRTELYIPLA